MLLLKKQVVIIHHTGMYNVPLEISNNMFLEYGIGVVF